MRQNTTIKRIKQQAKHQQTTEAARIKTSKQASKQASKQPQDNKARNTTTMNKQRKKARKPIVQEPKQ